MLLVMLTGLAMVPGARDLTRASQPRTNVSEGEFKARCEYVRTASDDPIVFPGQPGASHSHDFFGNGFSGATLTDEDLSSGATTCNIAADRSAYWAPSLYMGGQQVRPTHVAAYYVNGDKLGQRPRWPYALGLRMIAGDGHAVSPQGRAVTNWVCNDTVSRLSGAPPQSCPPGAHVGLRILFPDCWNGRDLDSADHKMHMAYSLPDGKCPATHPVPQPKLVMIVHYPISGGDVTLASGGMHSGHADFVNGWEQGTMNSLVVNCLNRGVVCR